VGAMKLRNRLLCALAIGIVITATSIAAMYLLYSSGANDAARIAWWPNTVLQALVPAPNIGTPERPLLEGTPVHYLAFLASFPLGLLAYSVLAFRVLSLRNCRRTVFPE